MLRILYVRSMRNEKRYFILDSIIWVITLVYRVVHIELDNFQFISEI